ncbi:hypothetical protein T484DRAFT_1839175, partial [Baffinella frigidus]
AATLIFSTPHNPLAQPRNLIFGHILCATTGVACSYLAPTADADGLMSHVPPFYTPVMTRASSLVP